MLTAQSEQELQSELDLSAGGCRLINRARVARRRTVLSVQLAVGEGRKKVGVIKEIEKLCAELNRQSLHDSSVFDHGKIEVV